MSQTAAIAAEIAQKYPSGGIFALFGDLGSGKTTFVQQFCKHIGVSTPVLSPTFVITRIYPIPNSEAKVFHLDLYRINQNFDQLGLSEIFHQPKAYVFVEWPEKIGSLLPANHIKVYFTHLGESSRQIEIKE